MSFEVQSAALVAEPESLTIQGMTAAQSRGLKYQAKVETELSKLHSPAKLILRPWLRYKQKGEVKKCQPDALLISDAHITIIEIKYSTTARAWHQLSTLYKPVIERAYRVPVFLTMVTRMFDPHVGFPCSISQLEGLERLDGWRGEGLGVVSWR